MWVAETDTSVPSVPGERNLRDTPPLHDRILHAPLLLLQAHTSLL